MESQDLTSSVFEHADEFFGSPLSVLQGTWNPAILSGVLALPPLFYSCQLVSWARRGFCFPRAAAFNTESVSGISIGKTRCVLNPIIISALWKPAGQVFSSVSLVQPGTLVLHRHESVNTGKRCVFPGVVLDFLWDTRVSTVCNTLAVSLLEERRFILPSLTLET